MKTSTNTESKQTVDVPQMPENFQAVISDFLNDLSITFPDYAHLWNKWSDPKMPESELHSLFNYLLTVYPERFFDILYQNEEIFLSTSTINTQFLPNIDFKLLYNCDNISKTTKKTMWKYLQLILFTIINSVKDKYNFGETQNLFDGINEEELHAKLVETVSSISEFFTNMNTQQSNQTETAETSDTSNDADVWEDCDDNEPTEANGNFKSDKTDKSIFDNIPGMNEFTKTFNFEKMGKNIPKPEELHQHLKGLFDGKIGKLAQELAEEISGDFSDLIDKNDTSIKTTQDVLNKLLKNPTKMMDLMKLVNNKITKKMNDGELSQDDIMREAGDLIGKMKDMGGMEQFNEMFNTLKKQMGGMGKNAKIDTNALDRMSKKQIIKQRILNRLEQKKITTAAAAALLSQKSIPPTNPLITNYSIVSTENPDNYIFRTTDGNAQEKSIKPISQSEEIDMIMASLELSSNKTDNNSNIRSSGSKNKKKNKKHTK